MRIGFLLKGLQGYFAHVKPFVDNNSTNNYFVFHLDKFFGKTEAYKGIKDKVGFVDLSYKFSIEKIVANYRLDYLVFFNPGNLFEQAVILICKRNEIKTVYFQHGVNPDYKKIGLTRKSYINWFKLSSIIKRYFFYYMILLLMIFKYNNHKYYKYLFERTKSLIHKDKNSITRNYGTSEVHTDLHFVYNQADKEFIVKNLRIENSNVEILGYPFIESKNLIPINKKYILYISSALRPSKVINIGLEEELLFYQNLSEVVETTNYKLVIKLHPLDNHQAITNSLIDYKEVTIFTDYNLADLVLNAEIIIGDLSSALFYAVKYYKPIVLLTYPYLKNYVFDLTDWQIGIKSNLNNLSGLINSLNTSDCINMSSYNDFLQNFLNYTGKSSYEIFFNRLIK